jgi:hypothetical protein
MRAVSPMRQPGSHTSSSATSRRSSAKIAGPAVKLDGTDGTTPILIADPADPSLLVLQVPIR